jgi:hypothetical protein
MNDNFMCAMMILLDNFFILVLSHTYIVITIALM